MVASTEVKRRRVMSRDHDDIARYVTEELDRRSKSEWRRKHEDRWNQVDLQIAMEPPLVINQDEQPEKPGDWHNAIQLGDLSDASETITADLLRLIFPTERKWFVPHVELPTEIDEDGRPMPVLPEVQRRANGVLRNLMVQQHKDFGVRNRVKLALKEILHHGSVVMSVSHEKLRKYEGGSRPKHLKAPVPKVHSMWNCFPDTGPSVHNTEIFYTGSMIIREFMPLQKALEMPNWINKDQLREQNKRMELEDHIEVIYYYGDVFLKRHDGNILFPNRKTTVSSEVFLESVVYDTAYSPIIYTGYERDDVRDPYYTSPIVKRSPMQTFATHMANRTMDSVDLKVDPPVTYDSLDNSMRGEGPKIYPGAKIGTRGGQNVQTLDVGDPQTGLAAMQWAKQSLVEGTTVDPVRKGVSPGTEQTATEIVKTEQRAEVREVEVVAVLESQMMLPYLIMQHDLNLQGLENYPFYNDELHTPDFYRATKRDLPKSVIMEVTGSRTLLGEEQRTARFINTVTMVAQLEPVARGTDWDEVRRQMWEDTRVKDPERFLLDSDRNAEIQRVQEEAQAQIQQLQEQMGQQVQQIQQQAAQAQDAQRKAEVQAQQTALRLEQQKLQTARLELEKDTLEQRLILTREAERAEDQLERMQQDIREREIRMQTQQRERAVKEQKEQKIMQLAERLTS